MWAEHDLGALASTYGTDKGPDGHGYTRHYQRLLGARRLEPLRLLEIGVWRGGSLRMWEQWFPQAQITGVDIAPEQTIETDRVSTIVADVNEWLPNHCFDIVIDDGSHEPDDVVSARRRLWPWVEPGGWYVVEDVQSAVVIDAVTVGIRRVKSDVAEIHIFPSEHPSRVELSQPWQIVFIRKAPNG